MATKAEIAEPVTSTLGWCLDGHCKQCPGSVKSLYVIVCKHDCHK